MEFSLSLPGRGEPIVGRVKLMAMRKQTGYLRASFEFEPLPDADKERLEIALFDSALARLA